MSIFVQVLNVVLALGLAATIAYLLFMFDETMIAVERIGLGISGGMVLLSLGLSVLQGGPNPSTFWYQWLWRVGWLLYLHGRIYRLHGHKRKNRQMKDIAGAWMIDNPRATRVKEN